jgi:hypothetical protein
MGFSTEEIAQLADRLVDAVVAWGDLDAVTARIAAHQRAGADHVTVGVITESPETLPVDDLRRLAKMLLSK